MGVNTAQGHAPPGRPVENGNPRIRSPTTHFALATLRMKAVSLFVSCS